MQLQAILNKKYIFTIFSKVTVNVLKCESKTQTTQDNVGFINIFIKFVNMTPDKMLDAKHMSVILYLCIFVSSIRICFPSIWKCLLTYLTIYAKGDEHQEEKDWPQGGQGKTLDGLRVNNERQSRPCSNSNKWRRLMSVRKSCRVTVRICHANILIQQCNVVS